jgi:hypothetical protein
MGTISTQNDKYTPLFEQGPATGTTASAVAANSALWSADRMAVNRAAGIGAMEVGGRNQVRFKFFGTAAASAIDLYGEKEVAGGGYTLDWLGSITPTLGAGVAPAGMPGCGGVAGTWVDEATVTANGNGAIGTDGVEVRPASGGGNVTTVFRADAMGYERIVVKMPTGLNMLWYGY